jgi:hypothetical protein
MPGSSGLVVALDSPGRRGTHFERHCTQARETRIDAVERLLALVCAALIDAVSIAWLARGGFCFGASVILRLSSVHG